MRDSENVMVTMNKNKTVRTEHNGMQNKNIVFRDEL